MIPVTKPFLPPREEYERYLKGVWERNWLTNDGPLVNELEQRLKEYLGISHLLYTGNGTIALQLAIKALGLKGEIITTPFSYVATTSSIVWEGCTPVFVDIDPQTCNIDPQKIEDAITPRTSAILATHVYGIPCDVEAISTIAKKYNLRVIYDAAHAFGTTYKGWSLFDYGDISTTSFHATKIFHTVEGGAVMTRDPELDKRLAFMRNFGHDGPGHFNGVGINGKNSEFHAAMGLANLAYIEKVLERRKLQHGWYDVALRELDHKKICVSSGLDKWNHSYYPILVRSEEVLLGAISELAKNQIFPRRYFYPILSELEYLNRVYDLPNALKCSRLVLSLPLYHSLMKREVDLIAKVLLRAQHNYSCG